MFYTNYNNILFSYWLLLVERTKKGKKNYCYLIISDLQSNKVTKSNAICFQRVFSGPK